MGNNPYPLVLESDYERRCCDLCNTHVINARIASVKYGWSAKQCYEYFWFGIPVFPEDSFNANFRGV